MTKAQVGLRLALIIVSAVPLYWVAFPPLIDLPGHVARYSIAEAIAGSPFLAAHYTYDLRLIGNLGVDLPVRLLSPILGVETSTKLIVGLIPPLTTAALLSISVSRYGRVTPFAILACCFTFSYPLHWGWVNYCLGIAVGFGAIALDLRLKNDRARPFLLAASGFVIWLCHALAWGVIGLLFFFFRFRSRPALNAVIPNAIRFVPYLLIPVALQLYWMLSYPQQPETSGFFAIGDKASIAMRVLGYTDQHAGLVILTALGGMALVFAVLLRPRVSWPMVCGMLALGTLYLVMPQFLMGSWGADLRMAPLLFVCALLAVRGRSSNGMVAAASAALIAVCGYWTVEYDRLAKQSQRRMLVAEQVEPRSRVIGFIVSDCDDAPQPRMLTGHDVQLLIGRRHAFVPTWDFGNMNALRVRYSSYDKEKLKGLVAASPWGCTKRDWPLERVLAAVTPGAIDYVFLTGPGAQRPELPKTFELIASNEEASLYRLP